MSLKKRFPITTKLRNNFRKLEELTRPVDEKTSRALKMRWEELPDHVKTDSQTLGRIGIGCEGTHGVFPKCNFACKPCYHSKDANKVRIDGQHTLHQVESQMAYLHETRAPHAHAQLIGGEVSLLSPDDHAQTIASMRRFGREPMSFTHGDFEYDYLLQLATQKNGKPRFKRLSFASHFDTTMVGRKGQRKVSDEKEIDPYREKFCNMFKRLKLETKTNYYLAHNMTVTPSNANQISGVISRCKKMGFNMFSFQPAAYVGNEMRWDQDYSSLDPDFIWNQIELGAGSTLPFDAFAVGDLRCNRAAWGFYVGNRWLSFIDPSDPEDIKTRTAFLKYFGGVYFNAPLKLLIPRLLRLAASKPELVPIAFCYLRRLISRSGGVKTLISSEITPMTFVMHRFMHADDVRPAWELIKRGELSLNPKIRETQERLLACSYAMAHPENNEIVPACVQHSLLDTKENQVLADLLPLPRRRKQNEELDFVNA